MNFIFLVWNTSISVCRKDNKPKQSGNLRRPWASSPDLEFQMTSFFAWLSFQMTSSLYLLTQFVLRGVTISNIAYMTFGSEVLKCFYTYSYNVPFCINSWHDSITWDTWVWIVIIWVWIVLCSESGSCAVGSVWPPVHRSPELWA